jgi:hypothetical protein
MKQKLRRLSITDVDARKEIIFDKNMKDGISLLINTKCTTNKDSNLTLNDNKLEYNRTSTFSNINKYDESFNIIGEENSITNVTNNMNSS